MALAREKREERKRDEDADTIGTSKKKYDSTGTGASYLHPVDLRLACAVQACTLRDREGSGDGRSEVED
jgi:hypothetical protein